MKIDYDIDLDTILFVGLFALLITFLFLFLSKALIHDKTAYEECIIRISDTEDFDVRITICDRIK